ncbi:MAG TPA: SGNH/GDSL hydrolase family protein [Bacillota bacterium]|nr:SGNH/GDSL hydrolase family protein [Bacillota bacterium]
MQRQTLGGITFVVSLALFFLISDYLAGWYVYHRMGFDSNFRFEDGAHVKGEVLDLYLEYIAEQKGYKIAVIGDSVVQGAGVPQRDQTITAHLQDELRGSYLPGARVFNLGLPGGRSADLFMAVKKLHEAGAAQLIVVNISYPFFSDEMAQIPVLYDKVWAPCLTEEEKKDLRVTASEQAEQVDRTEPEEAGGFMDAEKFLQGKIASYWNVYRFRQELNRFLFGGRPADKAREYFDLAFKGVTPAQEQAAEPGREEPLSEKDKPENKYKVWESFSWSERDLEHLAKVFNVTDKNANFKYYQKICRYLEENKIPAVIFMSPVNHSLLRKYQLINYDSYRVNTGLIGQVARQSNITFLNYQESVSPDLFHDSMHMLDGGNAITARLLSRDLQPLIQGALGK